MPRAGARQRPGPRRGFFQVIAHYGFMETPTCRRCSTRLPRRSVARARRSIKSRWRRPTSSAARRCCRTGPSSMATWRKRLFILMSRNAQTASAFFGLPPNRVVEMGAQIEL